MLILVCFLPGCEENKVVPHPTSETVNYEQMPDQISWNIDIIFVDTSFTKANIKARRARVFQKKMETYLDSGLHVDFFSKTDFKRESYLDADSAKIDDRTKNMVARGHVVVISEKDHRRVETSVMEWNNITQKLSSKEFVKITSPVEKIEGYGFESDPNLNNYRIFKVSGEQK